MLRACQTLCTSEGNSAQLHAQIKYEIVYETFKSLKGFISIRSICVYYRLEVVQQLRELEQPLCAGGLPMVARQAVQLLHVGGSQFIKTALALLALHWHCDHKARAQQ